MTIIAGSIEAWLISGGPLATSNDEADESANTCPGHDEPWVLASQHHHHTGPEQPARQGSNPDSIDRVVELMAFPELRCLRIDHTGIVVRCVPSRQCRTDSRSRGLHC